MTTGRKRSECGLLVLIAVKMSVVAICNMQIFKQCVFITSLYKLLFLLLYSKLLKELRGSKFSMYVRSTEALKDFLQIYSLMKKQSNPFLQSTVTWLAASDHLFSGQTRYNLHFC